MLKVRQVQQLKATYVVELNTDEFFEFDIVFDIDKQEWALVGESQYYRTSNRYSQAELKTILKIITGLNARDVKEIPKKKAKKKSKK